MTQIENSTWNNSFKLDLKDWRTYLIFTPGLIGAILFILFLPIGKATYPKSLSIANLLLVLYLLLLVGTQAYLVLSFFKRSGKRFSLLGLNAMIPVLFFSAYFIFVLYRFMIPVVQNTTTHFGPIRHMDGGVRGTIISVLLLHSFITFFFINNRMVARQIKKEPERAIQLELDSHYLAPMWNLVRGSLIMILVFFTISILSDFIGLN